MAAVVGMGRLHHSRPTCLFAEFRFHTGVWSGGKTKPGSDPLFEVGSDLEGGTFVFSLSSDSIPGSDLEERHDQVQVSRYPDVTCKFRSTASISFALPCTTVNAGGGVTAVCDGN